MKKIFLSILFLFLFSAGFSQDWTWMKGNNIINDWGTYGTMGVPSATANPGSRHAGATWVDAAGNFWLFGGETYDAGGNGYLNDLWKYDLPSGIWTWVKGDSTVNHFGEYGIQTTSSINNQPGSRKNSASWKDNSGNLWLFGGYGFSASDSGRLNDLWKVSKPATYSFTGSGNWNTSSNWSNG